MAGYNAEDNDNSTIASTDTIDCPVDTDGTSQQPNQRSQQ
jgi:hypothetical protein